MQKGLGTTPILNAPKFNVFTGLNIQTKIFTYIGVKDTKISARIYKRRIIKFLFVNYYPYWNNRLQDRPAKILRTFRQKNLVIFKFHDQNRPTYGSILVGTRKRIGHL